MNELGIPVVVLCGGQGTRMGDMLTKKELIDIGGRPLLWHVLRIFTAYQHRNFVLALGHLGDQVRRYFLEYEAMSRDTTVYLGAPGQDNGRSPLEFHGTPTHKPWQVTMVDTGLQTEKAGRIAQLAPYLNGERFFVAYGEAVANINLDDLLAFHRNHGKLATITGIQVSFQYGVINAEEDGSVFGFDEKPPLPYWINGGFMLFEQAVLPIIEQAAHGDLERDVLPQLAAQNELALYRHTGYWQSMKTLKDALQLKEAWERDRPWQMWSEM
ncbi:MAG TPA: sugar phosphate nucleotidyltransferase [Anaerolineae bacterium]|nr:sugar phosphate nucleotidyltransferase [Anaerolineae bacterium]